MSSSLVKLFRPAVILYAIKSVAALIIISPVMVYLYRVFEFSRLADSFWPNPGGLLLVELFWHSQQMIQVVLPLLLIIGLLYFIALQFLYGGICAYVLDNSGFTKQRFFGACGKHFGGFLKIAIAAIPFYIMILSIADLIGRLIAGIFSAIIGDFSGVFIRLAVLFLALFMMTGYLINLRFIQIANENSSLRFAFAASKKTVFNRLRYFLALNIFAGIVMLIFMAILFLILNLILKLHFSQLALILFIVIQQLMVFIWCYIEAFQINLNVKLFKESNYGTKVEQA